jgi:signal transduction histidine kinase
LGAAADGAGRSRSRAALANYVQDWSAAVGIRAKLHTSGLLDERFPADTETALYRLPRRR